MISQVIDLLTIWVWLLRSIRVYLVFYVSLLKPHINKSFAHQ